MRWSQLFALWVLLLFVGCGQDERSTTASPSSPPGGSPSDPSPAPPSEPGTEPGQRVLAPLPMTRANDGLTVSALSKGSTSGSGTQEILAAEQCNLPVQYTGYAGLQSLEFAYVNYTYELYIGGNYDGHSRLPLVFVFAGDAMTGGLIRSWLSLEWNSGGSAIFVYPNGIGLSWDTSTAPGINSSLSLVDAILSDVESKLCVDTKRIFAWGISRGAFMVNHIGCYRGNVFRGIIANSGGGPSSQNPADRDANNFFKCPTPPVAAFIIHGDADQTIIFGAGDDSQRHWKVANGCSDETVGVDPGPCVAYQGCKNPVTWCHLGGWPHQLWTASEPAVWRFIESTKE
ncbi:alpha/beta hydrolase family esterase [Labilithrix luteola]|nr:hypothetical protein [Labilithrix luteola]